MKAAGPKARSVTVSLGKMFLKGEKRFITGIQRKRLELSGEKNLFHTSFMDLL